MKPDFSCSVALVIGVCVCVLSCSTGEAPSQPENPIPERGSIRVTTNVEGEPLSLDPDGFIIRVGQAIKAIATNGTMNFLDLEVGSYSVTLEGAAEHCTTLGENPRQARVLASQVTPVDFSITCEDWTLPIVVTTTTQGRQIDTDGYTVSLDGGSSLSIGINDTLTYDDVSTGRHEVLLGGLDASCALLNSNPRTVFLSAQFSRVIMNFRVAC